MARIKKRSGQAPMVTPEELAQAVSEDTAVLELEKLQKKIAREERKQRKVIETKKQKKAIWLLPSLLFFTAFLSWLLSKITW